MWVIAFVGTGITQNGKDSFLVALSGMASNMTVTGVANTPTDTMIILDLPSSMYNGSFGLIIKFGYYGFYCPK